jgi:putative SOS response-associated peptidase YedK
VCGRARLPEDYSEIKIKLALDDLAPAPNWRGSWNLAPRQDMLTVVRNPATGKRAPIKARWGLIPSWARDAKIGDKTFNARGGSIDSVASFRGAWNSGRRCLVVTDGFYEWRKADRQPFAIARVNDQLTVLAGLWELWQAPGGETIRSCTVITCPANDLIAPLHDRMPVVLAEEDWPAWLGEAPTTNAALKALLKPFPSDRMKLWPISKKVNNWRNDGPDLIDPLVA